MKLTTLDWMVVLLYGLVTVSVGLYYTRRASAGTTEFFLGGRQISWWMLGTSLVATTFSTDTPNLVTDMVRTGGVSQNWLWWAFVLTGMTTVFFYAKLWRRSGMLTDIGFYELRYSGKPAAFLRGFRAVYLGVFFNVMIMATVTLAAIKIAGVMFGWGKYEVAVGAGALTALYCMASGLWGAVVTDFLLFIIAMAGSLMAAYFAVTHPDVGGLAGLFSHPAVQPKLSLLPDFSDTSTAMAVIIVPLAVQWWSAWYPGAEPGGGGYVAQRMLAAKTERDALKATLFFNLAHYALRPWPWILVALASLVVYPSLESIQAAFPHLDPSIVRNDLAYPAMLVFLPHGILGLVVASLAAAYMSTVATHLNWGASYMVDDVYRRFMAPDRSERHYVGVGRVATLILVVLASAVSLWLQNALQAFQILLQVGAGTGLVFLMRWFWWRINAWSELAAMVVSFLVALWFQFAHTRVGFAPMPAHIQLVVGVLITSAGWIAVTLLTPPADRSTLQSFYDHIRPMGPGWRGAGIALAGSDASESAAAGFLSVFLGCAVIYSALFGTGYALYGRWIVGTVCLTAAAAAAWALLRVLPRVGLR